MILWSEPSFIAACIASKTTTVVALDTVGGIGFVLRNCFGSYGDGGGDNRVKRFVAYIGWVIVPREKIWIESPPHRFLLP